MDQEEKEIEVVPCGPEAPEEQQEATAGEEEHHHHHHHHHHHSHKHHSKLYYKYRNVMHYIKKPFKKKSFKFTLLFLLPVIALAIGAAVVMSLINNVDVEPNRPTEASAESRHLSNVAIVFSEVESPQLLVNPSLQNYMTDHNNERMWENIRSVSDVGVQKGDAVVFAYQVSRLPVNTTVKEAYVLLSESKDMSRSMRYAFDWNGYAYADLLKTGQTYYYETNVLLSDGEDVKTSGSFDTLLTPRLMAFDGPVNVRDIGGWTTESGERVKEGVLIRGSELDGVNVKEYQLSEQDFVSIYRYLGIVYDCDLRSPAEVSTKVSPLGQNTGYGLYNIFAYDAAFEKEGMASMKTLFSDLAKPENYPMYMHCAYGKDRTGTVCAILEALLGFSKEDVIKEYQLSGLEFSGTEKISLQSEFSSFIDKFEALPGKSYREKAESYLLSCGVTEAEIASVRDIFL